MTRPLGNLSVNPASGFYNNAGYTSAGNAVDDFAIPQGLSSAKQAGGFEQQSFLGASIRNFNISAGFGDNTSTLNVDLVNDEYNKSDGTATGYGDDPYHSGIYDTFVPPPVGSPVFFKFGKTKATTTQAYSAFYDQVYGVTVTNPAVRPVNPGRFHFCFGGILQSYVENRGPGGDPLYSVQVVDPREILSNVTLIMSDYAGSTYNTSNVFNLYGFLEYNPKKTTIDAFQREYSMGGSSILNKYVNINGSYYFRGIDLYYKNIGFINDGLGLTNTTYNTNQYSFTDTYPAVMPITGTGFSRKGPQGMPYYRIQQAMSSLMGMNGPLPNEYKDAGFGGFIKFRGLNYIVDLGGLPDKVPSLYFMDFDQINLLDFCLEVCSITSHELFVTLLPIIDHSICKRFYTYNNTKIGANKSSEIIGGIIRIDTIDKSYQPQYGAIKSYLDKLDSMGIPIENRDVGFELSNVPTDKFVVGAQEVDMYYFSNNNDRGNIQNRMSIHGKGTDDSTVNQWRLETMLKQQILPYYGKIGQAVTIAKGFGDYKQILLDASSLYAAGVGNYYVATEMELRAAAISYEKWADFLLMYNDVYMESTETDDAFEGAAFGNKPVPKGMGGFVQELSNNYAVTVPRCVWPGFNEEYELAQIPTPKDSCHPPYGYPLYFKRAEKIGVNGAGLASIQGELSQIVTDLASVYGNPNDKNHTMYVNDQLKRIQNTITESCGNSTSSDQFKLALFTAIKNGTPIGVVIASLEGAAHVQKMVSKFQKRTKENSMRVYNFLKKVADECLGKKFLVKIPREPNLYFNKNISLEQTSAGSAGGSGEDPVSPGYKYTAGPFGFRARAVNIKPDYEYSSDYAAVLTTARSVNNRSSLSMIESFLTYDDGSPRTVTGGLEINYNPVIDEYQTNYVIEPQGGYADFDLMNNFSSTNKPLAIHQGLVPVDMTPIMNGNRMGPYVRFDHSENLAFDTLSNSDFTQQSIDANYKIPDVASNFDNLQNTTFSFPQGIARNETTDPRRSASIAFVKCDVDENFYMPPKSSSQSFNVHARDVVDIGKFPTEPIKRRNAETCECETLLQFYSRHYVPHPTNMRTTQAILDFNRKERRDSQNNILGPLEYATNLKDLDTKHVYALITLPSQIVPKEDARFLDGPMSDINTQVFKHLLTMDVVKLPEFNNPRFMNVFPTDWGKKYKSSLSPSTTVNALNARKAAMDGLQFGFPQALQATAPSPVYPDLVVLPLRSTERCYGPWLSNYLNTNKWANLGGRVDFIKDENLAPWNFNGYDLMNDAGRLQAIFSNSLLLQSERGGAVIPSAPSGVYLGRYLNNVGPLLTNLNIDVSDGGIKSTLKFDLYTVSFGKLAKQKQEQIANISRERQKLRDERNALIRKGLGKNQSSASYTQQYTVINNVIQGAKSLSTLALSASPGVVSAHPIESSTVSKTTSVQTVASMTNPFDITSMMAVLEPDDAARKYNRSASMNMSDLFMPVDQGAGPNPYLHQGVDGIDDDTYNQQYA
jgi:hypothetical protein